MGRWFHHVDQPVDQGLRTISAAEVARHARLNDCWVICNRQVYDLSDFVLDHPGGEDLILQFAGKDLGNVLDDPVQHVHSNSAYLLLEEYLIGKVPADYVPTPAAPLPPPVAPVAGRAAGVVFAEANLSQAPSPPRSSLENRSPSPPSSNHLAPQPHALPAPAPPLTPPMLPAPSDLSALASPPVSARRPSLATAPQAAPMPPSSTPALAADRQAPYYTEGYGAAHTHAPAAASPAPVKAETGRSFVSLGWGVRRSKDKAKTSGNEDRASSRLGKLEPLAANIHQPITRQLGRKSSLLPRW